MSKPLIPLIYHPSSVLILDDSESFINSLSLRLPDNIPYCLFTQPSKALQTLKANQDTVNFEPEKVVSESFDHFDHREDRATLQVDYGKFSVSLTNPKRFNLFSCLIVDYTMPEMNGLEFLAQIKDWPIEKIMLTGTADEKMALEAHNQDLVNLFYMKTSSQVVNDIIDKLAELQHRHFIRLSEKFVSLVNHYEAIFCNQEFYKEFNKLAASHSIVEHYVLNREGSLLLVSNNGEAFEMEFFTADDLDELSLMAKDSGLDESFISQLEGRMSIPVGIRHWLHLPKSDKPSETNKLNKVSGADSLYYSLQPLGNLINHNKAFVSFDYFIGNLWPSY